MNWSDRIGDGLERLKSKLPLVGILAFSLCSVNSVYHLLADRAIHPIDLLWFAAALVELTTAWLVAQTVDIFRKVTQSRISKQDRRFYGGVLTLFLALCVPSLGLSIWSNTVEFGTVWIGMMFPLLSVACAIGAALPGVTAKWEKDKAKAKAEDVKKRAERKAEREREVQEQAKQAQRLAELGETSRRVLAEWQKSPGAAQAEIAQALNVQRQVVGYHTQQLEKVGLITRKDGVLQVIAAVRSDNGKE